MPVADDLIRAAADLLTLGASAGCLYLVACSFCVSRFGEKRVRAAARARPPVTILAPLCGGEPGLASRLLRLCEQSYDGPVQVVCGVRDADDPAIEIVRSVARRHPAAVDLCVDARVYGRNLKISNLINMTRMARHDVLVMVDGDIEVGPDYLATLAEELQQAGVGAVTCLYSGVPGGGLWSRLAAADINAGFLPNAVTGLRFGLAEPCFGATIALTRDAIERIGGFNAFADRLWDDYAIGAAVRALGLKVAVSACVPGHVSADRSARELLSHQLRAARTVRGIDPRGYAGQLLAHPFGLALAALLIGAGEAALALAAAALLCRVFVARSVERRFRAAPTPLWLLVMRDLASFAVHLAGFFGSTVVWRGRRYRVAPGGRLLPYA